MYRLIYIYIIMGNSASKKLKNYENCVGEELGLWNDNNGCEEEMDTGNIANIKKCKIDCLNHWIGKLKIQKENLEKNVNNLERKLKRLTESAEKAAANSGLATESASTSESQSSW